MSQIEKIGLALFGKSWMAQVARVLKNSDGKSLSRQTVQSWHNRDKVPNWALHQLLFIANQRQLEIDSIKQYLNDINMNNEFYVEFNNEEITQYDVINAFLENTDKYFLESGIIFDEHGHAI